jgi:squalene-hopene/tetraprenyl-beta-curcumene cyclase
MAPDGYADTPVAKAGLDGIRKFLARHAAVTLHQRAMTLWASVYVEGLLAADAQAKIVSDLMSSQRPDGGWSLASLVDNTSDPLFAGSDRAIQAKSEAGYGTEFLAYVGPDKVYKSSLSSDGYATGFVIFVARQAGMAVADARLRRGIEWLKTNQRESGRWFTPSQAWHTRHLISNAGTAFAVLALEACGEVPSEKRPLGVGSQ